MERTDSTTACAADGYSGDWGLTVRPSVKFHVGVYVVGSVGAFAGALWCEIEDTFRKNALNNELFGFVQKGGLT
jgi:hypothetical protein